MGLVKQQRPVIMSNQGLAVLDELNVGAFTVDLNRKVTAMNMSAQALIGLKQPEVIGRDCREIFTGIPCMVACLLRHQSRGTAGEPDVEIKNEKGTKRLLTRMAIPLYDHRRRLWGCLTILQDHSPITDLIDRIHYEERSLKIILDHLDVGIFTVNRSGHITFFNSEAETITGHSRREVLGKPCAAIFGNDNAADMCLLEAAMQTGESRRSQRGQMRTVEGDDIPVRASYIALKNEKGSVVGGLATFHDLTLVHQLDQVISERYTFHDMIGRSPLMQRIFDTVSVVAETDTTILIEGPTGTGKDLLAKIIHSTSRRATQPLIKVNCAAIPDNLIESELFGYVKGAFTGAQRDKSGRFQEANGGTIFLDEIGDVPLPLQAKLLRVLEDREFYPLGSRNTHKVDVRIISATNRRLDDLVAEGLFREDLFYRLNVFRLDLPALKERKIDLPLLIRHVLRRLSAAHGSRPVTIDKAAMRLLLNYDYPGNVRELENILEHALIIGQEGPMIPEHLPDYIHRPPSTQPSRTVSVNHSPGEANNNERQRILAALEDHRGHRGNTARALGIDRSTLWRKMKRHHLL